MGLDHGPPNFCQKVWFLIMGTMVIIPILSMLLFNEKLDINYWFGATLIVLGILVISINPS